MAHYRSAYRVRKQKRPSALRPVIFFVAAALVLIGVIWFVKSTLMIDPVTGALAESATTNSLTLRWDKVRTAQRYQIYKADEETPFAEVTEPTYTAEDLESGALYEYDITAVRENWGKTRISKRVRLSAYTTPEAAVNLSAETPSKGQLAFAWDAVKNAAGYEVSYAPENGEAKTEEVRDAAFTLSDLDEGEVRLFKVRAFAGEGDARAYAAWSEEITARVARAVDMTGVDPDKPMVALTFDDGPDYTDITFRILDKLKEYGGHATFFQLGSRAEECTEQMKRIADEGHEVGCHTYDHSHYGKNVTESDIIEGDDAIEKVCGIRPTVFRSTGGMTTDLIRETCKKENMPLFYWSVDTNDWRSRNADAVYSEVVNHVSDGDIILMHNIYSSTAEAVERLIPYLVDKGYQLVTVSQLVQAKTGEPPVPGTQYYTATYTD